MTRYRFICCTLVVLNTATEASAQGDPPADLGTVAPQIIDEPPAPEAAMGAVYELPQAEPGEGTTAVDITPVSVEARPGDRVPASEIRPKGEEEMMGEHPVGHRGITFQPGRGLEINSDDDEFQLRIRLRVQFLYTLAKGDLGPRESNEFEDLRNDFRIRRARIIFQGHAFGKNNKYKFQIDPLRPDNVVLDYYLDFTQHRDVEVRIGQYKISSNRQRVISSGNLQMVDRSAVSAEFSLDRDIGIDVRSRDFLGLNRMRYVLGISSGQGINNFHFQDFGMVYLVRLEYLPLGIFEDYSEVDFDRTGPRLSIGATYAYFLHAEKLLGMVGPLFADGGTANYQFGYADVMFKARGFSMLSEFALRNGVRIVGDNTDPNGDPVAPTLPSNGWGWMAQAGYLIPKIRLEFAGRGSIIRPTGLETSLQSRNGVTFSASWYFFQHPFKIQADVSKDWSAERFFEGGTTVRIQLQASL